MRGEETGSRVFLGIESFRRHMSDEGWQLQAGMHEAGFDLWGRGLPNDSVDVPAILRAAKPDTVILQDKREWNPSDVACIDKSERFIGYELLGRRNGMMRLTILKDVQHNVLDGYRTANICGLHAWIVYYHPKMVKFLAPYVREHHLLRTYHSIDRDKVPEFADRSKRCLLSGASTEDVYPLRFKLFHANLEHIDKHKHPGYHANGSHTNSFLEKLAKYRVAICTASIYGYALRKLIEATACGCRVITDLPPDEVLPEIDGNLVRVSPNTPPKLVDALAREMSETWDYNVQAEFARKAVEFYDYRRQTQKLAFDILALRRSINRR